MLGEWNECKKCGSEEIVKNSLQDGVQRYKMKIQVAYAKAMRPQMWLLFEGLY